MPMIKQPITIEHALLGFVRQQPMHGYQIHQHLQASAALGMVWSIKQGLLYASLTRLEQEGLLTSSQPVAQGIKAARKMLQLTAAGEVAFLQWVRSPVGHGRDFRIEFLAKLYFSRQESTAIALELVARQRWATRQRLAELQQQAAILADNHSYEWLVVCYRIGQLEATQQWLDLCSDWLMIVEQSPAAPPPAELSAEAID
jgi:DNA-binding PadR family transcriptional regulator